MSRPSPHDLDDEELLGRYADDAGDTALREAAFREIVRRYGRRVFVVCVRVLGSAEDAEDATQETFVRAARGAAGFRGDARLSTWLYRIARNVCTDHVRYDARRPSTPFDDLESVAEPDADRLGASETALAVGAALRQLDERSRTLLLMVAVDGMSYAEVSEVTGLAIGTIKSRVSRARVRLGELIRGGNEDAGRPLPRSDVAPAAGAEPSGDPRAPPGG